MAFHRQISQSLEIVSNIQRKNFDLNVRHRGSRPSISVRSFGSFTTERVCFFLLKKAHIALCLLQVIARCASRGLYDWDIRSKTSRERAVWNTLPVMWIRRKSSEWWSSSAHFYRTAIPRSQHRSLTKKPLRS